MTREELIEHQREEIKALKAANLDLQIHFDAMKAELHDFEEWWCSTPILRESKRTIAEKAWLAAHLNATPESAGN